MAITAITRSALAAVLAALAISAAPSSNAAAGGGRGGSQSVGLTPDGRPAQPLIDAIAHGRVDAAHALLDEALAGGGVPALDLDAADPLGWTALHLAAMGASGEGGDGLDWVARRLVAAGAKLDLVTKRGMSALMLACYKRRAAPALLLAERGARLDLVDRAGKSALDYCLEGGLGEAAEAIRARGGKAGASNTGGAI